MSPPNDSRDGEDNHPPLSLSSSASAPHSQVPIFQKSFVSSGASAHSCPTELRRFSSVYGGPSFDQHTEIAPMPSPPAFITVSLDNVESNASEALDKLSFENNCSVVTNSDANEPESESATEVEKGSYLDISERGMRRNMEGGGESAVIVQSSITRRRSIESIEQQMRRKLGRVEDVAAINDNDDLCGSVGHKSCPFSEHPSSEEAETGEISDLSVDNVEGSTDGAPSTPTSDAEDENIMTATSSWTKRRNSPYTDEVGAVQMDDQAPQLNRRFFRGLDQPSVRAGARGRLRRRISQASSQARSQSREMRQDVDNRGVQMEGGRVGDGVREARALAHCPRSPSLSESIATVLAHADIGETLLTARLVGEDEGEVVVAERMGFFERKGRTLGPVMCAAVLVLAASLSVSAGRNAGPTVTARSYVPMGSEEPSEVPSLQPSTQPSSPPSHDPRPTLEIVQTRGYLKCGLHAKRVSKEGLHFELCRAIAAVLLGNPDSIEIVGGYFQLLADRAVDVSVFGSTHTIEREIHEKRTGSGFAFSSPYYYDGMSYFGNETYVQCAESKTRYDACSSLRICSFNGSTSCGYVQSAFPSDFVQVVNDYDMVWNDTCNVFACDRSTLLRMEASEENRQRGYVVGDRILSKEPIAAVTRNDDREFSNLVDWTVNALFYGEAKGLTRDPSLCGGGAAPAARPSDLNFLNAVYCVGNYGEIFSDRHRHVTNRVNDGSTAMLYAIPFGNLEARRDDPASGDALLQGIRKRGSLNCGVVVPVGLAANATGAMGLAGMSRDYCRTLAAALFNGKSEAVSVFAYPEDDGSSFAALRNGTIDALAGGSGQWKHYLETTPSLMGFRFSTPYYYKNEDRDVNFFSMVTREEDATLSLFVNCAVLSTMYAQERRIVRESSEDMPLISFFGGNFNWALRDAISYSGSYDEMYARNFGDVAKVDRGRNFLNANKGPQIHYLPDLDVILQKTGDGGLF